MPHAYYMLRLDFSSEDDKDRLDLLWGYGICLYYDGRYIEAETSFERVGETCKKKLGADRLDTLTSMGNLALTYGKLGRWDEAEKLQVQVMEIRKTKFGADHPGTLRSAGNLAMTYWKQGRWKEAEKLQVRRGKMGLEYSCLYNTVSWNCESLQPDNHNSLAQREWASIIRLADIIHV